MKISLIYLPGVLLCGLLASGVVAQPALGTECENPRTNEQITRCALQEWQSADAKLDRTYRRTMEDMKRRASGAADRPDDDDPATRLRLAQRRWLAYRDAACLTRRALAEGGSMRQVYYYNCLAELTRQRIKELEKLRDY